jgi:hypothetical protein
MAEERVVESGGHSLRGDSHTGDSVISRSPRKNSNIKTMLFPGTIVFQAM